MNVESSSTGQSDATLKAALSCQSMPNSAIGSDPDGEPRPLWEVAESDFASRLRRAREMILVPDGPAVMAVSPGVSLGMYPDPPLRAAIGVEFPSSPPGASAQTQSAVAAPIRVLAHAIVSRVDSAESCAFDVVVPSLGRIKVRLDRRAGRLGVSLCAAHPPTHALLEDMLDALRGALHAAGVPHEIDLTVPGPASQTP